VSAHVSPRDLKPAFLPEPRHGHHAAGVELVEQPAKLRPVRLRPARHFGEHFFASGLRELAHLGVNALAASQGRLWVENRHSFGVSEITLLGHTPCSRSREERCNIR